MHNETILDIQNYYNSRLKNINDYITKICNIFKTKINYNSFCLKILNFKINKKPVRKLYSKSIKRHVYILVVATWTLVEKFIEDDPVLIYDVVNLNKKKITQAEYEIFLDIVNMRDFIKKPRSKSF